MSLLDRMSDANSDQPRQPSTPSFSEFQGFQTTAWKNGESPHKRRTRAAPFQAALTSGLDRRIDDDPGAGGSNQPSLARRMASPAREHEGQPASRKGTHLPQQRPTPGKHATKQLSTAKPVTTKLGTLKRPTQKRSPSDHGPRQERNDQKPLIARFGMGEPMSPSTSTSLGLNWARDTSATQGHSGKATGKKKTLGKHPDIQTEPVSHPLSLATYHEHQAQVLTQPDTPAFPPISKPAPLPRHMSSHALTPRATLGMEHPHTDVTEESSVDILPVKRDASESPPNHAIPMVVVSEQQEVTASTPIQAAPEPTIMQTELPALDLSHTFVPLSLTAQSEDVTQPMMLSTPSTAAAGLPDNLSPPAVAETRFSFTPIYSLVEREQAEWANVREMKDAYTNLCQLQGDMQDAQNAVQMTIQRFEEEIARLCQAARQAEENFTQQSRAFMALADRSRNGGPGIIGPAQAQLTAGLDGASQPFNAVLAERESESLDETSTAPQTTKELPYTPLPVVDSNNTIPSRNMIVRASDETQRYPRVVSAVEIMASSSGTISTRAHEGTNSPLDHIEPMLDQSNSAKSSKDSLSTKDDLAKIVGPTVTVQDSGKNGSANGANPVNTAPNSVSVLEDQTNKDTREQDRLDWETREREAAARRQEEYLKKREAFQLQKRRDFVEAIRLETLNAHLPNGSMTNINSISSGPPALGKPSPTLQIPAAADQTTISGGAMLGSKKVSPVLATTSQEGQPDAYSPTSKAYSHDVGRDNQGLHKDILVKIEPEATPPFCGSPDSIRQNYVRKRPAEPMTQPAGPLESQEEYLQRPVKKPRGTTEPDFNGGLYNEVVSHGYVPPSAVPSPEGFEPRFYGSRHQTSLERSDQDDLATAVPQTVMAREHGPYPTQNNYQHGAEAASGEAQAQGPPLPQYNDNFMDERDDAFRGYDRHSHSRTPPPRHRYSDSPNADRGRSPVRNRSYSPRSYRSEVSRRASLARSRSDDRSPTQRRDRSPDRYLRHSPSLERRSSERLTDRHVDNSWRPYEDYSAHSLPRRYVRPITPPMSGGPGSGPTYHYPNHHRPRTPVPPYASSQAPYGRPFAHSHHNFYREEPAYRSRDAGGVPLPAGPSAPRSEISRHPVAARRSDVFPSAGSRSRDYSPEHHRPALSRERRSPLPYTARGRGRGARGGARGTRGSFTNRFS